MRKEWPLHELKVEKTAHCCINEVSKASGAGALGALGVGIGAHRLGVWAGAAQRQATRRGGAGVGVTGDRKKVTG
jgi:hypothetical protein